MSRLPSFRGVGTTWPMNPVKGEGRVFPNVSLAGVELEIDKYNCFRRTSLFCP